MGRALGGSFARFGSHSVGMWRTRLAPFHRLIRSIARSPGCVSSAACADCPAHAPQLQDFLALQHFAHGCERVFSPDRWAMTGESGVFTDPFYSPGSDFIAIGNDFATDLIIRDLRGEDVRERTEIFNATHLRLFDAFLKLYDGQYPLMGNAQVMTAKVAWDNAAYWSVTALLFFQRRLRHPEFMATIDPLMRRFFVPTHACSSCSQHGARGPPRVRASRANVMEVGQACGSCRAVWTGR